MGSRAALFAGGAFAGIVAGWLFAQYRFTQHRQDAYCLFRVLNEFLQQQQQLPVVMAAGDRM